MAERDVAKPTEGKEDVSQPRAGESARTQVFGNPGDSETLQLFRNLHSAANGAGVQPLDLNMGSSLTADARAPMPGQPQAFNVDPERRGTAIIQSTYPGVGTMGGSAFPVNLDGIATTPRDGQRLFATNAHVVSDLLSGTPDAVYKFGGNLFTDKAILSQGDLLAKGQSIINDVRTGKTPPPENSTADGVAGAYSRQLDYLSKHFDEIKSFSGGANGITQAGLDRFRKQNERISAVTDAGNFGLRTVAKDDGRDVAIVQACNLTPQQQEALGPDRKLADRDPRPGDFVVFRGYPRGQFSKEDSYVFGTQRPRDKYRETVPTIKTWPGTDHGGSGSEVDFVDSRGPRTPEPLSARTEVIGMAHETDDRSGVPKQGHIMPVSALKHLLARIQSGEIPLQRCP